jgi:mannose-6-phosphate isomerase-like protein (cupin superfamily)
MAAMTIYRNESDLPADANGRRTGGLVDAASGATKGFCLGVNFYDVVEYGPPGVHDDQEAIYILEGTGTARVGGQEFPLRPGTAFFVAPGVPHAVKRDRTSPPVKVLWTHGAI